MEMKRRIIESILFSQCPVHLILHVTNRCNLRCKTCFVDFGEAEKEDEISLSEINEMAQCLDKIIWLDISGGEPFLRNDLPDICSIFNTKSIGIPTNGFNPNLIYSQTKEIISAVNAELSISVSIDGFQDTNDSIRNRGAFNNAIETVRALKDVEGLRVKVNTVLCNANYGEMIDFMQFVRKMNVEFHSIIFLRGKPRNSDFSLPSYNKLCKIKNKVFDVWSTYDYGVRGFDMKILQQYQRRMYETSLKVIKNKKQYPKCFANKYHLVVYSNGDISFCEMLDTFGNLREEKLNVILKSDKAENMRKKIKRKDCYCHHNCNMIDNFFLNPLQYPKLVPRSISQ